MLSPGSRQRACLDRPGERLFHRVRAASSIFPSPSPLLPAAAPPGPRSLGRSRTEGCPAGKPHWPDSPGSPPSAPRLAAKASCRAAGQAPAPGGVGAAPSGLRSERSFELVAPARRKVWDLGSVLRGRTPQWPRRSFLSGRVGRAGGAQR